MEILKNKFLVFGGIFAIFAVILWSLVSAVSPQPFKIAFLDVGQGDSILIRTREGKNVLIDGGPDKTVLYKLEKYLPWYDRNIDAMILTHPHADHLIGLIETMKRYKVERIISTGVIHTTPEYLEWLNLIKEKKIPAESFKKGDRLLLDNGISLTALSPDKNFIGQRVEDINATSLVFLLQTPKSKALLMGDAEDPIEKELIQNYSSVLRSSDERVNKNLLNINIEDISVLKVGHQGSRNGTSEEFLKIAKPKYAVIFAGLNNRFGHPHLDTLKRLHDSGAKILRTDENGDIVFTITKDGLLL
ncbi:MAG TPA: MBL fold metallo-hydrolase [Patescibacteria group bacterium]|nr:MBL fold metallo-hydrolase [Patescibacteria group bacterium]